MYILENYPETRENKNKLCMTYLAYYNCSPTCIPTVDREARYIQNTLWFFKPSFEEQEKRLKHSAKKREEYKTPIYF